MILDKVRQTIARYTMLNKGDRVLVGVSGGPDSTALLYILNALKKEYGLKLFMAHLNHMIRRMDAEKDALFVKRIAERLNLPIVMESKDVPRTAKGRRCSLEEAARDARYEFYLKAAQRFNAGRIALAHTEDDQAETVLMRLIRGSGLLGLSGMPPVRNFADKKIIRPLIEISKNEIEKFLKAKKIGFRTDKTNTLPIYLRNRVRRELIPILEKGFNPGIKKILKETARNLRIDYDFISRIGEKKFKKYSQIKKRFLACRQGRLHPAISGARDDNRVEIDIKFLDEDAAIQRLIFREAIRAVKGNLEAVAYRHWEDLNGLLRKKTRWSLDLPGRVRVKRGASALIFTKAGQPALTAGRECPAYPKVSGALYKVNCPGATRIAEAGKILRADFIKSPPDFHSKKNRKEEFFDFEKLKLPIYLRFRRAGDMIRPIGMNSDKKLKRLFVDEKVALESRAKTPLLISGEKIIWVCGVKRSDNAKITKRTKRILKVRCEPLY